MTEQELSFDDILQKFIEKIEKVSIKNALNNKLIINRITGETIEIITISKVAQLLFSNIENMKYIEEKMSEVLGKPTTVHIQFENKEDYFSRKLENM